MLRASRSTRGEVQAQCETAVALKRNRACVSSSLFPTVGALNYLSAAAKKQANIRAVATDQLPNAIAGVLEPLAGVAENAAIAIPRDDVAIWKTARDAAEDLVLSIANVFRPQHLNPPADVTYLRPRRKWTRQRPFSRLDGTFGHTLKLRERRVLMDWVRGLPGIEGVATNVSGRTRSASLRHQAAASGSFRKA